MSKHSEAVTKIAGSIADTAQLLIESPDTELLYSVVAILRRQADLLENWAGMRMEIRLNEL